MHTGLPYDVNQAERAKLRPQIYVGDLVSEKLLLYCIKQVQHIHVCLYSSGLPGATRTSADQKKDSGG